MEQVFIKDERKDVGNNLDLAIMLVDRSRYFADMARMLLSEHLRIFVNPIHKLGHVAFFPPRDLVAENILKSESLMTLVPQVVESKSFDVTILEDERIGWMLRDPTGNVDARVGWVCTLDIFPPIHGEFIRTQMKRSQFEKHIIYEKSDSNLLVVTFENPNVFLRIDYDRKPGHEIRFGFTPPDAEDDVPFWVGFIFDSKCPIKDRHLKDVTVTLGRYPF